MFPFLDSNAQEIDEHWKDFKPKNWVINIDKKADVVKPKLNAKTRTILSFSKNKILVQYAVFDKNRYPELRKRYDLSGGCITDSLSGEHGQISSFFEFKDNYYIKLGKYCGNCLDEDDSTIDCRDLDASILKYRIDRTTSSNSR